MLAQLIEPIAAMGGLTPAEAEQLAAHFQVQSLQKGDVWAERGTIGPGLAIIESGLLCYFHHRDGDEIATYLALPGALVAEMQGLLRNLPSPERIVALADTRLWLLPKPDLFHLIETLPNGWRFYARLLAYHIGCIDDSKQEALLLTALERYQRLLDKEPQLLLYAPLQHVAQVLGITPQHLSRIRKQLAVAKG